MAKEKVAQVVADSPKKANPNKRMTFQLFSKKDALMLIVDGSMIEVTETDLRALRKFLKTGAKMAGDEIYGEIQFQLEEWPD